MQAAGYRWDAARCAETSVTRRRRGELAGYSASAVKPGRDGTGWCGFRGRFGRFRGGLGTFQERFYSRLRVMAGMERVAPALGFSAPADETCGVLAARRVVVAAGLRAGVCRVAGFLDEGVVRYGGNRDARDFRGFEALKPNDVNVKRFLKLFLADHRSKRKISSYTRHLELYCQLSSDDKNMVFVSLCSPE
ncbi:hypothetical protein C8J57DRAFT_1248982 [Mycena rebaudengoi]|nr:hypothetical protein C8J57DRAFT_1248982 [Mycena rebaudengoi]